MTRDAPPFRRSPLPCRRLGLRLGLTLILGAALILLAAGAWNIGLQREHMTLLLERSANSTSDLILRSTRDAMLANDPEALERMLGAMAEQPGVERIRVFDKQGSIQRSTDPADLGAMVDKDAEQCFACHAADQPLGRLEGRQRTRTFETVDGRRVLGVIAPIRNEPDCTSCHVHPADLQVLGVLDVQLSLEPVKDQLAASERQLGLGLLLTVAAVVALGGWLVKRQVLDPVQELTAASTRVAAGDLGVRTRVTRNDEIGILGRTWNDMVAELAHVRAELERWSHTLEARVEDKTRELEAAHRSMLLIEKMASLGKLSAVVAHEINNPLAGIATYARLLGKRFADRTDLDDAPRILELVAGEAMRCGNIVRNLLAFSRESKVCVAEEHPAALLERCTMLLHHQADLQQVDVRVAVDDDVPEVTCDAAQIQQLVLALAMNAIEAMPDGGELCLRARLDARADELVLDVEDTGWGIRPEHLDHIYEPFWTTKSESKGSGLGLAVAFGIVQRHHGRIDVRSAPGQGTTFTVRLPLRPPPGAVAAADMLEEIVR